MLKIRALNRESSSDEDIPIIRREAQEEIALELYNNALRLQAEEQYIESELVLLQLLNENIPLLENNGGLPKSMQTLKYSCHVNLGNIDLKLNKVAKALETFLLASELDATDVTLWYKIGTLSLKENKFRQSAYAFSKGLECSESHWPCLDQLISILFAIKDTIACLVYIGKALMLDSEYTKGLVLRRQIYLDNPATKEYYQLYNPDYIWEPSLDVAIDEDDIKTFLEEALLLCERVTQVEKSFGPKPLQTIPLPKPLEEYSWLSLANTVIFLHQYITDNRMSHFTMVDTTNCMSQTSENNCKTIHADPEIEVKPSEKRVIEKVSEEKDHNQIIEVSADGQENKHVEVMPERRASQNSEANNDGRENTPVQTDNDEEQNMDQDNEEQDENIETKAERGRPRGSKRKRDLLSDLQIWGWHSKRKQSKKAKERDFTVEDALNRIIPSNLLPNKIESADKSIQMEDSMNTMDIYKLYMEVHDFNYLSPIHSPASVNYEPYFETDREKDQVQEFWTKKRDYCDAIVLIKDFVFSLSKLWHYKWPKELVPLYIEAYNMFREHCDPPQVFCGDHTFEQIRDDALATILYGELLTFSSENKETIHPTLLGYLQIISGWHEQWLEEYPSFFNRVFWLRSHLFRKENYNDLASRSLQLIQEVIAERETKCDEKYLLSLPNCFRHGLITKQITDKILKHLDLINALNTVENLYNAEKYREVADILKNTFKHNTRHHPQVGRMGRPAQLGLLLHSLWFTDLTECFIWTEECIYEAIDHFLKPTKDPDKWEKIIEKCLAILHEVIKTETINVIDFLTEEKRARLVETLSKIVCKQLNTDSINIPLSCVTPWILLHYILVREEQRQYANKRINRGKKDKTDNTNDVHENVDEELHPSIAILFSAHEFLGPKGWCLTGEGELLHFILDTVLDRLDTPIFERLRDKIDIHIEQALFCLYQHPSKKNKVSRHLADHNVDPLSLTWERSFQLFEFYGPSYLPEFNSYKNASISADLEQLFKRIIALVPQNCTPQQHLPKIMDYIHGKSEKCPEPIDFPNKVRSIFYLIGDFYFKQREFNRCIKYFQMDLCINPLRLDSWACLGLSYAAQLDSKLNYCEKFKNDTEFLDKAKYASICFKKALEISPDPLMLWIECGTFQYTVHAYCSRILKFESENLSMEKFEFLENQKNSYLDSSGNSFEKAIALYEIEENNEPDERWLQYYILGKIAEKKQKEPAEYLQYYMTASTLLDENNAQYPEKINYNNPQHLAVEALELHYRVYASVLKYLELHEGKDIPNTLGEFFKKCLNSSKFFNKPAPKPVPEVLPIKSAESSSLGFQEQFLNSLNKLSESDMGTPLEEEQDDIKKCEKENDPIVEQSQSSVDKNISEDRNLVKEPSKIEKADVESIIMISDSDDEGNKKTPIKTEEQEEVTLKNSEKVKDVQQMLDEMMVQTMKETEQEQNELDSDLSGTEKIEEVVVKDEKEFNENKEEKIETPKNEEPVKKIKQCDSETDTENIKTSADDTNSSSSSSDSSSESSDSESDDDDSSSSSSSSSSEADNENMSTNEISQLIDKCTSGLEICIIRLAQNYKALYRLAHLYFNYKSKRDMTKCKQLLLHDYKCKDGTVISGLFSDRKPNNFFNGIWRIPSTEIDRPGSLSAHMSRCITLVLQILRTTNDTKTLIDLCLHLRKTPEPDKIYIKDSDRMAFSEQALTMCIQCLRAQIKNVPNMTNPQIVKLLQEVFKIYQRVQKHLPGKEGPFASMLIEVYRKFIKEKIPDNVNILDLATKFCLQHKSSENPKPQVLNPTPPIPRGPGIASPPVLPTPSNVTPPQNIPLKRPGSGRPRGRPPLPKLPGQIRQPRGKAPNLPGMSKSYSWQKSLFDQSYAYEYLKHYQDELIKQYSQNLNLNQLTQLSQILAQGQIHNPVTASAITNQFLAQTGLLNPSALVKQLNSSGNVSQASTIQLLDSLKQLTPSLKKKLGLDQSLSTLTADQLAFLGMSPSMGTSKSAVPHTVTSPSGIISSKTKLSTSHIKQNPSSSGMCNTQIFKEPNAAKSTSPEEKCSKDLMKERPNISITPVSTSLPPPSTVSSSFMKPTTSPSAGKTLQEKLAEKKKEQQNKHLKNDVEADVHNSNALKKSLNLPNIPSSLTLSKTTVPITSSPIPVIHPSVTRTCVDIPQSIPNILKATNASSLPPKFPLDVGRSITMPGSSSYPNVTKAAGISSSLMVPSSGVALPTPKFPVDSGISISQVSQVSNNQPLQSKEKSNKSIVRIDPSKKRQTFSLGSSIEVLPVKGKSEKYVSKKITQEISNKPAENPPLNSVKFAESINVIKNDKKYTPPLKNVKSVGSDTTKSEKRKIISDLKIVKQNKMISNKNINFQINSQEIKKTPMDDDDVICID